MSLYDSGLRARLVHCNVSQKCGGKPFIQDNIVFEETEHYKKGCTVCGGIGVQVVFEPASDSPMKFTEKDVGFYDDEAQGAYQGREPFSVLPGGELDLRDRYRFQVPYPG